MKRSSPKMLVVAPASKSRSFGPPDWNFFDLSKTGVHCPGDQWPCDPKPSTLKGCYGAGEGNGLLNIWFPAPAPTPFTKRPNKKKWCTHSDHPHQCYSNCQHDSDCSTPYYPTPYYPPPPTPQFPTPQFPTPPPPHASKVHQTQPLQQPPGISSFCHARMVRTTQVLYRVTCCILAEGGLAPKAFPKNQK